MALLTLISNRAAALRALPPSAIKPITRSLKSCEYGAGISPPMALSRSSFANQQAPENPSLYVSTRSETALAWQIYTGLCPGHCPTSEAAPRPASADRDLARHRFLRLSQGQGQDAVFKLRADLLLVYLVR